MARTLVNPAEYILIESSAGEVKTGDGRLHYPTASFVVKLLSGIAAGSSGVISTDFSESLDGAQTAENLVNSVGEWCAVGERVRGTGKEFIVFGDAYAYCPIFYSVIAGKGVVVSTSFNGVVSGLRRNNALPSINVDHYAALLTTNSSLFQGPLGGQTMAEQIRILPVGKALSIGEDFLSIVDRACLDTTRGQRDTEASLEAGLHEIVATIKELVGVPEIERVIHLSGGVDSRLVLGLLRLSGNEKSFQVYSGDPRGAKGHARDVFEKDADIASGMVRDLQLDWFEGSDKHRVPMSFLTSLFLHQSYNSNYAFDRGLPSSLDIASTPVLSLLGGGGEILRTPSGPLVVADRLESERKNLALGSGEAGAWVIRNQPVIPQLRERVGHVFEQELIEARGASLRERFVDLYFRGRNRTHFGQTRSSTARHYVPLHLLSNAHFLSASESASFSDRLDGRLVKWIFRNTDPTLLGYPFESGTATSSFSNSSLKEIGTRSLWEPPFNSYRAKNSRIVSTFRSQAGVSENRQQRGSFQVQLNYLRSSFSKIESQLENDDAKLLHAQHERVLSSAMRGAVKPDVLVSKVASAIDVFSSTFDGGTPRKLFTSPQEARDSRQRINVLDSVLPLSEIESTFERVFEQHPVLQLVEGGFYASANPDISSQLRVRYAFYLMHDGVRVSHRWYESDASAFFDFEPVPGDYYVVSFARMEGKQSTIYQEKSPSIVLK